MVKIKNNEIRWRTAVHVSYDDLLDIRVVPESEDEQDTDADQALERKAQTHADGGEQEHKRRQHIERIRPVTPRIHTDPQQVLHQVHAVEQSIDSLTEPHTVIIIY